MADRRLDALLGAVVAEVRPDAACISAYNALAGADMVEMSDFIKSKSQTFSSERWYKDEAWISGE